MSGSNRIMHYVRLGRIAYSPALNLQHICAKAMMSGKRQPNGADGALLLLEHDPVYTVGLRSHRYPENVADDLRKLGADFQRTNRGGLITFHGPGQLVVYPILHLRHWGHGVKSYVDALEHTIIRACGALGVRGERSTKYTGVWIGRNKIAAIGWFQSLYFYFSVCPGAVCVCFCSLLSCLIIIKLSYGRPACLASLAAHCHVYLLSLFYCILFIDKSNVNFVLVPIWF